MLFFISFFLFLQDGKLCRYNWRGRTPTQRKKNGDVMNVTRFFFGFCCFQVMAEEKSRCWIMWHQQLFFRVGGGGVWNVKWIGLVSSWNNNLKEKDRACCTVWGLFTREQTRMWKQKGTRISTLKEVNDRLTLRKQSDQSFLYCPTVYVRWWVFLNHFLNDAAQSVAVATCVFDLTHACSFFFIDIEVVIYDRRTSENGPNLNAL